MNKYRDKNEGVVCSIDVSLAVRCGAIGCGGVSPPSRSEAASAMHIRQEDTYGLAGWRRDAASPKVCGVQEGRMHAEVGPGWGTHAGGMSLH